MVLFVAAVIAVVLLVMLAFFVRVRARPATFRIQRSTRIQAPPEKIFPFISDFHNWTSWSPYEKLDPAMAKRYSGLPAAKARSTRGTARRPAKGEWRL